MKRIAIIGSGPAGLMVAHQLKGVAEVSIFESGESLEDRFSKPNPSLTEGFGGCGSVSDGKFNLSPRIGNKLFEILPERLIGETIEKVRRIYYNFGAPQNAVKMSEYGEDFMRLTRSAGFDLIRGATVHFGTDKGREVVSNILNSMKNKVEIHTESRVCPDNFRKRNDKVGVCYKSYSDYDCEYFDFLVLAPGRSGADWMNETSKKSNLPFIPGATDIGIRYECRNEVFEDFYQYSYEPKLSIRSSFDERVRLFCSCLKDGEVALEHYKHLGIDCVNGHSYSEGNSEKISGNANFAVLVTTQFTRPFNNPNAYCKSICQTANTLAGGGVLCQTFADLMKKRRSTEKRIQENGVNLSYPKAVPGDISYVIPHRQMTGIMEFIERLNIVFPGVSRGVMYCPEVKMYSNEADIDPKTLAYKMVDYIYPVGDASGWTRSLAGASVHGYLVAQSIKERL